MISTRFASALLAGAIGWLPSSALPAEATPAQAKETPETASEYAIPDAVDAAKGAVESVRLKPLDELGYFDEDGIYVRDVLEGDHAYLAIRVETEDGRPVVNAVPDIAISGSSRELKGADYALPGKSDDYGVFEFVVSPGAMGRDEITLTLGKASIVQRLNIISFEAAGFPQPPVVEGGIPWSLLFEAQVEYRDDGLVVEFPESLSAKAGKQVKLSGFMLPLDPELKQRRFLLTASPPSCFFHVPGGAAGAVEVFAPDGVEISWDPIVLEGQFEPLSNSKEGVVYRLRGARQLSL